LPTAPPRGPVESRAAAAAAKAPSRAFLTVIAVLGLVALAGGTSYQVVTHPGRVLPPVDPKVRAAGPPRGGAAEEPEEADPGPKQSQGESARPATKAAPKAGAADGKSPTKAPEAKKTAEAKQAPEAKQAAEAPALGPPPSHAEIRGCLDKRKSRLRTCADEAAQRMEFPGGGTARARMNPSGKFTNISVPGGGYFSSCAARVIRGLQCRAYRGEPIDVTYPLR
jgi:hypothetical protein